MTRDERFLMLGWVAVCLVLNGFIFSFGWNDRATLPLEPGWKPAGWVIGMVWVILFACMGYAHGRLWQRNDPWHWGVVALLVGCLAYPLYTGGLQSGLAAFYGTWATLAWVLVLMTRVQDVRVAWLMLPVALWLCFAACLIFTTLRLNGVFTA